jgi:hypothetical protein
VIAGLEVPSGTGAWSMLLGATFEQQNDRVGLVLLPGGEGWIAAGKGLDLSASVVGMLVPSP